MYYYLFGTFLSLNILFKHTMCVRLLVGIAYIKKHGKKEVAVQGILVLPIRAMRLGTRGNFVHFPVFW